MAHEIGLTLVDLFDWSPLGYMDLRYYVVRITYFPSRPVKVGQHARIDVAHASVLYDCADALAESERDTDVNAKDAPI